MSQGQSGHSHKRSKFGQSLRIWRHFTQRRHLFFCSIRFQTAKLYIITIDSGIAHGVKKQQRLSPRNHWFSPKSVGSTRGEIWKRRNARVITVALAGFRGATSCGLEGSSQQTIFDEFQRPKLWAKWIRNRLMWTKLQGNKSV